MIALVPYTLTVTLLSGGDLMTGAQYLGALCRTLAGLIAGAIYVGTANTDVNNKKYLTVRRDIIVLVALQLTVAGIQKFYPAVGDALIVSLQETQSAARAAVDGDVAGAFPNTIDLSYFLLAAFITLTQRNWMERKLPSLPVAALFIFASTATGSLVALFCLVLFVFALTLRSLFSRSLGVALLISLLVTAIVSILYFTQIYSGATDIVDNLMLSRLGLIIDSIPELYKRSPDGILVGFGTDFNHVLDLMRDGPRAPAALFDDGAVNIINDVFWTALSLGIGVPFALLYVKVSASLFVKYLASSRQNPSALHLAHLIWFMIIIAGLFNQVLIIRTFTTTIIYGLLPLALMTRATKKQSVMEATK
jgi:hypothetical protein